MEFNLFFSDLDLAVVYRESTSPDFLALLQCMHRAGKLLPFLGEMEVYSSREWEMRTAVMAQHPRIVDFIWYLRKWQWQLQDLEEAPSDYHRYKAIRALHKIHSALGVKDLAADAKPSPSLISQLFEFRFAPLLMDARIQGQTFSGKSPYLTWDFQDLRAALAALVPDLDWVFPDRRQEILALRQQTPLKVWAQAIATHEWLLIQSRRRLYGEDAQEWDKHLLEIMKA